MAKLRNVAQDELLAHKLTGEDLCIELHGINNRIEKGYCDEIESLVSLARSFLSLSRAAADTAAHLLVKASLQEQKRELEALLRSRTKSQR